MQYKQVTPLVKDLVEIRLLKGYHIILLGINLVSDINSVSHDLARNVRSHIHIVHDQSCSKLRDKNRLRVTNNTNFRNKSIVFRHAADPNGKSIHDSVQPGMNG